jgi:LmbE family N-acetylglucosaminyl deacetylase
MHRLLLSPHSDDATLFASYTLLREKPLVCTITDSYIQLNRGEDITPLQRWIEDVEAMKILGCPIIRLGIRDDFLNENMVRSGLLQFENFDEVYAPAIMGGNFQHDLVGMIATEIWGDKCKHYTTYTKVAPHTKGNIEIVPTIEEIELKNKALDCYKTQIGNTNKIYFEENKEKSEWFI